MAQAALSTKTVEERRPAQLAVEGTGPLMQRDYVGVIQGTGLTPEDVMLRVRTDFPSFSPKELADFTRPEDATQPLLPGDTMHVFMPGAGHAGVIISQAGPRNLTIRTLKGHIEAGRITFAADRDAAGRLVFHIRSRATIDNFPRLLAYWSAGIHMQTKIWTTFIRRVAEAAGGEILGEVVAATERTRETAADRGGDQTPDQEPTVR
jgi:hypothetical protein